MLLLDLIQHVRRPRPWIVEPDLSFGVRGAEVSRLEGFSDTVFGFAITLLVISLDVPRTAAALFAITHAILPFVASFALLFGIWRAQFDFFRRYRLEDRQTIRLTATLLMIVLLAIYPLKFLCTFMLDVLPRALLAGDQSMKAVMSVDDVPRAAMMYAAGFAGIALTFSRLYHHAGSQHAVLRLSEMERFDTRMLEVRWLWKSLMGISLVAGLAAAIVMHRAWPGDTGRTVGYGVLYALVLGTVFAFRRTLRRLRRERLSLATGAPTGAGVPAA